MSTEAIVGGFVGAAVVIGLIWWLAARARKVNRQRRAAQATARRMAQPRDPFQQDHIGGDPRTLKLGDVVEWLGSQGSYSIRGTATVRQGRYVWWEHFVDPIRGAKRYLTVSTDDGDVEVVVWTEVIGGFNIQPGRNQVTYSGVTYKRQETGSATYSTTGTTNLPSGGQVEYADYAGPGDRRLSFERFDGGEWELSLGEIIPDGQLTIYPTS